MKTILTVDDSPSIRQMVSFTVSSAGYRVVEAEDGEDALQKASLTAFDLVLTDQNMPKMDGFTLIKRLRSLPQYEKVPIIVLTTEASEEMKQRGRMVRASGWMVKPFDPDTLLSIIARLID
jgi:two-component system chemotaxis response regulator CheY